MKKYDFVDLVTWIMRTFYHLNCWERLGRTFLSNRKDVNILIKPKYFSVIKTYFSIFFVHGGYNESEISSFYNLQENLGQVKQKWYFRWNNVLKKHFK